MEKTIRPEVQQIVVAAVNEMNERLLPSQQLSLQFDMPLLGDESALDSLGFVDLILDIEQRVRDELGASVTLADERAFSLERSPFRSLESLCQLLEERLAEGANLLTHHESQRL